jgi:hypothetical protein
MTRLSIAALLLAFASVLDGQAALVHRYSFTNDASDSAGGAHGTIVDQGEPNATFRGGVLDVSSNEGYSHQQTDAYVSFPNSLIADAYNGGVAGEMTFEIWAQALENRDWAALFSAGNVPFDGAPVPENYIQFIPLARDFQGTFPFRITARSLFGSERFVDRLPAMSTTEPTHLAVVFNTTRIIPFPRPRHVGNFSVYIDGVLVGTNEYDDDLDVNRMTDARVWLGRSQFSADPIFDGMFDELRIYNSALTADEVARNYLLGPNVVPEPKSCWLFAIGVIAQLFVRRRATPPMSKVGQALPDKKAC